MSQHPHTPEWTRRYRNERRHPITLFLRFCRRHGGEPLVLMGGAALGLALAYGLFLAFCYALVHTPQLQP